MIYVRVNRWVKRGLLQAVSLHLQQIGIIQIPISVVSLDSSGIKVHLDGTGTLKKADRDPLGGCEADGSTKLHMVATSDPGGVMLALSAGNYGDVQEGYALLRKLGSADHSFYLLMDQAYEGHETRALAMERWLYTRGPAKSNHKNPWDYDKQLHTWRNQVEIFPLYQTVSPHFYPLCAVLKGNLVDLPPLRPCQ